MNDLRRRRPGPLPLLIWSILSAFAVLLICSKSSPLYPTNDWVDVQCFFTVGRGILQGKMPYLDLYEQKGPVLYLLFAAAALDSSGGFLGVFLLETVCVGLFLFEGARIAALFLREDSPSLYWLPPVMALCCCLCPAFCHGGSAEELFLPAAAAFLRLALKALGEDRALRRGEAFACGVLAALALWVKYTCCGLFAGGAAALLVWYLVSGRGRKLWEALLFSLLGLLAVSAPLLAWFALRGALSPLWEAYFLNNLTAYAASQGARHAPPIQAILSNWLWSLPAALGCLWLLLRRQRNRGQALFALLSAAALGFATYLNGRTYPYYALILCCFSPLGWAALLSLCRRPLARVKPVPAAAVSAALLLGCGAACHALSPNMYLTAYRQADLPAFRFAAIIREDPDASLFNYGFLDGGFYLAAGVEPENRFFCTFNMQLDAQEEEQRRILRDGLAKYVVIRGRGSPGDRYEKIDQCAFPFEGREWSYSLYRLKE